MHVNFTEKRTIRGQPREKQETEKLEGPTVQSTGHMHTNLTEKRKVRG